MFDFNAGKREMQAVVDRLDKDLKQFRIGRATPSLVENIMVEVYGSKMSIGQLANINIVDAHLLTIQPWDRQSREPIVKAINESNIGLNAVSEGDIIRIPIPPITEERRLELIKSLGQVTEGSKVRLRRIRKDLVGEIKRLKDEKEISADEEKRNKDLLQKVIDDFNTEIDKIMEQKREELKTV